MTVFAAVLAAVLLLVWLLALTAEVVLLRLRFREYVEATLDFAGAILAERSAEARSLGRDPPAPGPLPPTGFGAPNPGDPR